MWWNRIFLIGATALSLGLVLYISLPKEPTPNDSTRVQSTNHTAPGRTASQTDATSTVAARTTAGEVRNDGLVYTHTTTTVFWVGEKADASNGYIANDASAWDSNWQTHFGGIDDPEKRCGYVPCAFTPMENPFYIALPYNDLDSNGKPRVDAGQYIPWWTSSNPPLSQLKNRWVEISYKSRTCYGQWQDVGPYIDYDADYVFGSSAPRNTFGLRAGLDVSPALNDCLHLGGTGVAGWRFVEFADVPPGPWRDTVTTRDVSWD